MANGMKITWGYIHSLLSAASAAGISDAALLARYIEGRDESAFTELVRRHGPMVRGVCRRVLPSPQDAEDAFQATFLVLMNKAASIRKRASLACWLHGVALRVAVRLLRNNQRRQVQPLPPEGVPEPERDDVSWREVKRLVDEELARLPERYRMPLILCYLEGKTREEAAAELGWGLPAFRGRLERGRQRLRLRLERRGLALSAALLATLTAPDAEAAITTTTISTAASSQVAMLATEVMRTMMLIKLKMTALCCLAVLSVGVGVTATGYRMVHVEAGPPQGAAGPAVPPKPTPPEAAGPATPPKPPAPREDGVVKDYLVLLDTFKWAFTLKPPEEREEKAKFDAKYGLRYVVLHVQNIRFEPDPHSSTFALFDRGSNFRKPPV